MHRIIGCSITAEAGLQCAIRRAFVQIAINDTPPAPASGRSPRSSLPTNWRNFRVPAGFNFYKPRKVMNWKKFILLSCMVSCAFAISTVTAQTRGHRASTARMPMHRAPMLNSASRFQRSDRFRGFNRFNRGGFDRDDRFRRNEFIVFNDFGFPFFPFYYPYPYYPYGYGGYGYQSGYGYGGYGYQGGYGNRSSVVQLQRRLARAGYYHGAIDGIMGPATRRAIRSYEGTHNQRAYGMTDRY